MSPGPASPGPSSPAPGHRLVGGGVSLPPSLLIPRDRDPPASPLTPRSARALDLDSETAWLHASALEREGKWLHAATLTAALLEKIHEAENEGWGDEAVAAASAAVVAARNASPAAKRLTPLGAAFEAVADGGDGDGAGEALAAGVLRHELLRCVLDCSVAEAEAALLAEDSAFVRELKEAQGAADCRVGAWSPDAGGNGGGDGDGSMAGFGRGGGGGVRRREVRLRQAVRSKLSPVKQTAVHEAQRWRALPRARGAAVACTQQMPEAPYSDCFHIATKWVLMPLAADEGGAAAAAGGAAAAGAGAVGSDSTSARCEIAISAEVVFTKPTFFKKQIDASALDGVRASYADFASLARAHVANYRTAAEAAKAAEAAAAAAASSVFALPLLEAGGKGPKGGAVTDSGSSDYNSSNRSDRDALGAGSNRSHAYLQRRFRVPTLRGVGGGRSHSPSPQGSPQKAHAAPGGGRPVAKPAPPAPVLAPKPTLRRRRPRQRLKKKADKPPRPPKEVRV